MCFSPLVEELDRVLLVDDETDLTNLWRLILELTGRYTVREENRGERVLQTARKFRPHLIFLDRQLVDADGGEVAAKIRLDVDLKTTPIVFVTGSVTQEEAAWRGVFDGTPTLAKPFSSDALPDLANAVLNKHRKETEARIHRAANSDLQIRSSAAGL